MVAHILLVDDDALLRRSLAFKLERNGYQVSAVDNAEEALALARRDRPDLILLDIGLPGMDGLEAVREFRWRLAVPVIFLTARRRQIDHLLGLELGADDFITKPFDMDILLARVKVVLRRSQPTPQPGARDATPLVVGDIVLDPAAHTVTVCGRPVVLSPREFDLLHVLALEANHVVRFGQLLQRVWGAEYAGEPQVVYVELRRLREKIEDHPNAPRRLLTVRGVGYKLVGEVA